MPSLPLGFLAPSRPILNVIKWFSTKQQCLITAHFTATALQLYYRLDRTLQLDSMFNDGKQSGWWLKEGGGGICWTITISYCTNGAVLPPTLCPLTTAKPENQHPNSKNTSRIFHIQLYLYQVWQYPPLFTYRRCCVSDVTVYSNEDYLPLELKIWPNSVLQAKHNTHVLAALTVFSFTSSYHG